MSHDHKHTEIYGENGCDPRKGLEGIILSKPEQCQANTAITDDADNSHRRAIINSSSDAARKIYVHKIKLKALVQWMDLNSPHNWKN